MRTNFPTDKHLHGSAFYLHGTCGTVQVFGRGKQYAVCIRNKSCPVPCKRVAQLKNSFVQKFVGTGVFFVFLYVGGPSCVVRCPKAVKTKGTKRSDQKKNNNKKKNNQKKGNLQAKKIAKMGRGHLHTEPARQLRQGIEPRLPTS